jgi:type VI protein secretion system component VasK
MLMVNTMADIPPDQDIRHHRNRYRLHFALGFLTLIPAVWLIISFVAFSGGMTLDVSAVIIAIIGLIIFIAAIFFMIGRVHRRVYQKLKDINQFIGEYVEKEKKKEKAMRKKGQTKRGPRKKTW